MPAPLPDPLAAGTPQNALERDLVNFVGRLPDGGVGSNPGGYGYARRDLPSYDFNREVMPPGRSPSLPDGALGIRVDDDFWVVAVLPYRFVELPLQRVVALLWPDLVAEAAFGEDNVHA